PHPEPALDFEGLDDAFFRNTQRLGDDGNVSQAGRHLDDILRVLEVVLGEIPVSTIDSALEVHVVSRHVIGTDLVVDARSPAADGRYHVVAGLKFRDVWTNALDSSEILMADDQKVIALRAAPYSAALISLSVPSTPQRSRR